ncbi:DUF1439 domain-containing protein [uncultured Xylophilus sp.]|uniref:DUF1439 domain-containing protein n=1 Tax=uncultured Xylophilus sp. TaxID=296832 RepID=UPI0025DD425F|nr:DUF1439 domain-containing protein [uncultured Xylophilus sp.]
MPHRPAPSSAPAFSRSTRRRWLQALACSSALPALWPAASHAGYNIWTGEYTLDKATLQVGIEKRFPVNLRYAEVFQVQLTQPRIALDAQGNRLGIVSDARITSPLLLSAPMTGLLAVSSGLRFDPAARAVRLHEPAADRLELRGIAERDSRRLQAVGTVVAQEVLRDYPIHTFAPEELRFGTRDITLGDITVTADGVKVEVR